MKPHPFVLILGAGLFFLAVGILVGKNHAAYAALLPPAAMTFFVARAMLRADVDDQTIWADTPTIPDVKGNDGKAFLVSLYDKTIQMHVETDRGMYQLITVFVGASVLILGWVASNSKPSAVTPDLVLIVGSLAVVLVGVATLLKHRLRHYNKLRESYLRRLEEILLKEHDVNIRWGLHNFMKHADGLPRRSPWLRDLSFHEVVDVYYFIYAFVWVILFVWKTSQGFDE